MIARQVRSKWERWTREMDVDSRQNSLFLDDQTAIRTHEAKAALLYKDKTRYFNFLDNQNRDSDSCLRTRRRKRCTMIKAIKPPRRCQKFNFKAQYYDIVDARKPSPRFSHAPRLMPRTARAHYIGGLMNCTHRKDAMIEQSTVAPAKLTV